MENSEYLVVINLINLPYTELWQMHTHSFFLPRHGIEKHPKYVQTGKHTQS